MTSPASLAEEAREMVKAWGRPSHTLTGYNACQMLTRCATALDTYAHLEAQARSAGYESLEALVKREHERATRIGTHGPDCWSYGPRHYECALVEIDRLKAKVRGSVVSPSAALPGRIDPVREPAGGEG